MRATPLVLLACQCMLTSGCVVDLGVITAKWSFEKQATGALLECPAGFDTTAVHVIPIDSVGNRVGAGVVDTYSCGAFTGASEHPPDRYEVFMEITTATTSSIYANTPSTIVDITARDLAVTQVILDDAGYFRVRWNLLGSASGQALTCAQALATTIDIAATPLGSNTTIHDSFPCERGGGFTKGLLAGPYTVRLTAFDSANRAVGTQLLATLNIDAPNRTTDTGVIALPIDGK